ncbi:hypothetical protein NJB14194_07890, partial [Mycobacterium montefiorense]
MDKWLAIKVLDRYVGQLRVGVPGGCHHNGILLTDDIDVTRAAAGGSRAESDVDLTSLQQLEHDVSVGELQQLQMHVLAQTSPLLQDRKQKPCRQGLRTSDADSARPTLAHPSAGLN